MNGAAPAVEIPYGWNFPSPLYIDEDSNLQLSVRTATSCTLTLRARYMLCDGSVHGEEVRITPPTDRTEATVTARLRRGYLISLLVFSSAGAPGPGMTYAVVRLVRGLSGSVQLFHVLAKGYVVTEAGLFWPGGLYQNSDSGFGNLRSVLGADPAAGAQISQFVPTFARWRLGGFRATLVTSAVVANRQVHLVFDDGALPLLNLPANGTQAASLTRNYDASAMAAIPAAVASEIYIPLPQDLVLSAGWGISTVTDNMDGGDNWGAPLMLVEEWIEA